MTKILWPALAAAFFASVCLAGQHVQPGGQTANETGDSSSSAESAVDFTSNWTMTVTLDGSQSAVGSVYLFRVWGHIRAEGEPVRERYHLYCNSPDCEAQIKPLLFPGLPPSIPLFEWDPQLMEGSVGIAGRGALPAIQITLTSANDQLLGTGSVNGRAVSFGMVRSEGPVHAESGAVRDTR